MIPNFAISLTDDGLSVLFRRQGGWMLVGEVAADAPDLSAAMARLRRQAARLAPEGIRTKVFLPHSQVHWMALDGHRSALEVEAALAEEASVDPAALVYDISRDGERTYVAAVEDSTLEEARAFAEAHRLNPVAIAAAGRPGAFIGQPSFAAAEGVDAGTDPDPAVRVADGAVAGAEAADPAPDEGALAASDAPAPSLPLAAGSQDGPGPLDVDPPSTLRAGSAPGTDPAPAGPTESDRPGGETEPAAAPPFPAPDVPPPPGGREGEAGPDDPAGEAFSQAASTGGAASPPAEPDAQIAGGEDSAPHGSIDDDAARAAGPGGAEPAPERVDAAPGARAGGDEAPAPGHEPPRAGGPGDKAQPSGGDAVPPESVHEPDADADPVADPDAGPAPDPQPGPVDAGDGRPLFATRRDRGRLVSGSPSAEPVEGPAPPLFSSRRRPGLGDLPPAPGRIGFPAPPPGAPPTETPAAIRRRKAAQTGPAAMPPRPPEMDEVAATTPPAPVVEPLDDAAPGPGAAESVDTAGAMPAAPQAEDGAARPDGTSSPAAGPTPASDGAEDGSGPAPTTIPLAPARDAPPLAPPHPGIAHVAAQRQRLAGRGSAPAGIAATAAAASGTAATGSVPPRSTAAAPPRAPVSAPPPELAASLRPGAGLAGEADLSEEERFTIFGRRGIDPTPAAGRPRYLGLALVAALILVLALAALFGPGAADRVAGLLGGGEDAPTDVATALPGDTDGPAPSADISAPAQPGPTDPEGAPDLPVAEAEPGATTAPDAVAAPDEDVALAEEVEAPATPSPGAEVAPGAEAAPDADEAPSLAGALAEAIARGDAAETQPEAAADDGAETALAEPEPGEAEAVVPAPPPGVVPSPAEAERFYAATGVWVRGPRLPLEPEGDPAPRPDPAAMQPVPEPAAPADLALSAATPDLGLGLQLDPPAPGTIFARDANGFFLATPEGTVTPQGMTIFAGTPSQDPPTRPGTEPPEPELPPEGFLTAETAPPEMPPQRAPEPEPEPDAEIAAVEEVGTDQPGAESEAESESGAEPGTEEAIVARIVEAAPPGLPPLRPASEPLPDAGSEPDAPPAADAAPAAIALVETAPPGLPPLRPEAAPAPESPAEPDAADPGAAEAEPEAEAVTEAVAIVQAAPPGLPPLRPAAEVPASAAEPATEEVGEEAATAVDPAAVAVTSSAPPATPPQRPVVAAAPAPIPQEVPSSAGSPPALPPLRPGSTTDEEARATPGAVTLDALTPFDGDTPPLRPDSVAALAPLPGFDGPRPGSRPGDLAPETEEDGALAEAEIEDVPPEEAPADVGAAIAAIIGSGPDPLAGVTASAVSRAERPGSRPQNFGRVVDRAQTRIASAQPQAAPQPQQPAAQQPQRQVEEADSEPEQVSSAAARPSGPVPGGVAAAATANDAISLGEVNLIGVYGRPDNRRALIRQGNGRYIRVSVGDSLEGGQVTAIGDNALNYVVRGRTYYLEIPEG